jgi:hypothetical protein
MKKASSKIDLFKEKKTEYKAGATPVVIDTSPAQYLMIDGQGAPDGPTFEACIGAIYSVAYTIKMRCKAAARTDYVVSKLESIWYMPDPKMDFAATPRDQWQWTLMIRTPDHVTNDDLREAIDVLLDKGKAEKVQAVRLDDLDEGRCLQMLHKGPYDGIHETVLEIEKFAEAGHLALTGRHHEIYLSDPRRVAPENLKTLIRQPVS